MSKLNGDQVYRPEKRLPMAAYSKAVGARRKEYPARSRAILAEKIRKRKNPAFPRQHEGKSRVLSRVIEGARTPDLRNHNPPL